MPIPSWNYFSMGCKQIERNIQHNKCIFLGVGDTILRNAIFFISIDPEAE